MLSAKMSVTDVRRQGLPGRRAVLAVLVVAGALSAALLFVHRPGQAPSASSALPLSLGKGTELHGVACASATWCAAAGWYSLDGSSNRRHALVETWNGTRWSVARTPNPAPDTELHSIACPARDSCIAVGSAGEGAPSLPGALGMRWNGASWSLMSIPQPSGGSSLAAITCSTRQVCLGVGWSTTKTAQEPLAEEWKAGSWTVAGPPTPPGSATGWLSSISCAGVRSCMAVGAYSTSGDFEDPVSTTLVDAWDGARWSLVPSPNPGTGNLATLTGVACSGSTTCVAVGSYSTTNNPYRVDDQALVEFWDGDSWTVMPGPVFAGNADEDVLSDVACAKGGGGCVAIGYSTGSPYGTARAIAVRWDGRAWLPGTVRLPGTRSEGLACRSARSCLVVGEQTSPRDPVERALAYWDSGWQ